MDMYGQASSVSTWTTEKRREGPWPGTAAWGGPGGQHAPLRWCQRSWWRCAQQDDPRDLVDK